MQAEFVFQPVLLSTLLATIALFGVMIVARPSILLRPSVFYSVLMCITINIAAASVSKEVYEPVKELYAIRLSSLLLPVGVLLWVFLSPFLSSEAEGISRRCRMVRRGPFIPDHYERRAIRFLTVIMLLALSGYLLTVPLQSTGLWSILFDPDSSAEARERSLKMISVPAVGYLYLLFRTAVAPALFVLCVFSFSPRRLRSTAVFGGVALLCIVGVALEGARIPIGWLILASAIAYMITRGIWRGILVGSLCAVLVLSLAFAISVARMGDLAEIDDRAIESNSVGVLDRAFAAPFDTGVLTNRYAEEYGLLGTSTIRPITMFSGEEWINLPNAVNRTYFPYLRESGSVNTAFLFDFQASFGVWSGWFLSLILLAALDLILYVFRFARGMVLVAFVSSLMISMMYMISSSYTSSLLSGGVIVSMLIMVACRMRILKSEHAVDEGCSC